MSNLSIARSVGRYVLDLVYPSACALCSRGGPFLCDGCESRLVRADGVRCPRCWLPVAGTHCRACADHLPAFTVLRSLYRFQGEARELVHAFKFGHQSVLSEPLGGLLAGLIDSCFLDADALVPVPLRVMRQRQRGYNQAALLAREAGKQLALPVLDVLSRRGAADAQARAVTAEQRRRNVEGAFHLRRGRDVASLNLLLVDDVATTGATLDACARALLSGGAASVSAVTLARED